MASRPITRKYLVIPTCNKSVNVLYLQPDPGYKFNLYLACGVCDTELEVEMTASGNFGTSLTCANLECDQRGRCRMGGRSQQEYDTFYVEGNFKMESSEAEILDDSLILRGEAQDPRGEQFFVMLNEDGDAEMPGEEHVKWMHKHDNYRIAPWEVTGFRLSIHET